MKEEFFSLFERKGFESFFFAPKKKNEKEGGKGCTLDCLRTRGLSQFIFSASGITVRIGNADFSFFNKL